MAAAAWAVAADGMGSGMEKNTADGEEVRPEEHGAWGQGRWSEEGARARATGAGADRVGGSRGCEGRQSRARWGRRGGEVLTERERGVEEIG